MCNLRTLLFPCYLWLWVGARSYRCIYLDLFAQGWPYIGVQVSTRIYFTTVSFSSPFSEMGMAPLQMRLFTGWWRDQSTSYDRYWEGRKSFASMTSNIRNLSRLIWVNVAPPPSDQEISIKGKTKIITPKQLERRKADALHLCLAFAFAVKHYLRGEDGTNWEDYRGLLPSSFLQAEDMGYRSDTYSATRSSSPSPSDSSTGAASLDRPNATKRVRVKRSKRHLVSQTTPLLSIQFVEETSLPLPLMLVPDPLFWPCLGWLFVASLMSWVEWYSIFVEMDC